MTQPIRQFQVDRLPVEVYADNAALGRAAAARAAEILRAVLAQEPEAHAIFATGNSQLTMFQALVQEAGIDWKRVSIYHMDEYVGMRADHPASFRRYLREKLVDQVHPGAFYGVEGDAPDPQEECRRYAALLEAHPAHLCCLGIGENGHLAFNDPPFADFNDPVKAKIVTLDEMSRRQQVGEGHFPNLDAVPRHAITLTIPALLAARQMLAIVPEARKAPAVQAALEGPLATACPASILRQAGHARLFLDAESAAMLV
jgi:glucosamine-6-phosphate deaminase